MSKKKYTHVSAEVRRNIAMEIVKTQGEKALKQIAGEFGVSYSLVYKVLREEVNVSKVLTLRERN